MYVVNLLSETTSTSGKMVDTTITNNEGRYRLPGQVRRASIATKTRRQQIPPQETYYRIPRKPLPFPASAQTSASKLGSDSTSCLEKPKCTRELMDVDTPNYKRSSAVNVLEDVYYMSIEEMDEQWDWLAKYNPTQLEGNSLKRPTRWDECTSPRIFSNFLSASQPTSPSTVLLSQSKRPAPRRVSFRPTGLRSKPIPEVLRLPGRFEGQPWNDKPVVKSILKATSRVSPEVAAASMNAANMWSQREDRYCAAERSKRMDQQERISYSC